MAEVGAPGGHRSDPRPVTVRRLAAPTREKAEQRENDDDDDDPHDDAEDAPPLTTHVRFAQFRRSNLRAFVQGGGVGVVWSGKRQPSWEGVAPASWRPDRREEGEWSILARNRARFRPGTTRLKWPCGCSRLHRRHRCYRGGGHRRGPPGRVRLAPRWPAQAPTRLGQLTSPRKSASISHVSRGLGVLSLSRAVSVVALAALVDQARAETRSILSAGTPARAAAAAFGTERRARVFGVGLVCHSLLVTGGGRNGYSGLSDVAQVFPGNEVF
jgi:hypothetical protein